VHARAGALRYFGRGAFEDTPVAEAIRRLSSALTARASGDGGGSSVAIRRFNGFLSAQP